MVADASNVAAANVAAAYCQMSDGACDAWAPTRLCAVAISAMPQQVCGGACSGARVVVCSGTFVGKRRGCGLRIFRRRLDECAAAFVAVEELK